MWINTATKQLLDSHSRVRSVFPNVSLPRVLTEEVLVSLGIEPVLLLPEPEYDLRTQRITRKAEATNTNGSWYLGWDIIQMSPEEVEHTRVAMSEEVRAARNQLLAATDWWAVQDRAMSQAEIDYRQALRDITVHANFPYLLDDDWPVKPD